MANLRPKVLNANGYDELLDDADNIQLVAAPATGDAAANKAYVDQQIDAINNPGGDPIYVRKAGDNMTGDLTLGTDKITLGVDGSGTYAGNIYSGTNVDSQTVVSNGFGYYRYDGNNVWFGYGDGGVYIGQGNDASVAEIKLSPDGNASFGSGNIKLNSNGTATFSDRVTTGDTNVRGQFLGLCPSSVTASSADAFVARYDNVDKFSVKYDGSGTFKGNVEIGGDSSSGTEAGCYLHSAGFVAAARDNEADAVWRSFTAGDSTEKIAFTAGGSATFAGPLEAASIDGGSY